MNWMFGNFSYIISELSRWFNNKNHIVFYFAYCLRKMQINIFHFPPASHKTTHHNNRQCSTVVQYRQHTHVVALGSYTVVVAGFFFLFSAPAPVASFDHLDQLCGCCCLLWESGVIILLRTFQTSPTSIRYWVTSCELKTKVNPRKMSKVFNWEYFSYVTLDDAVAYKVKWLNQTCDTCARCECSVLHFRKF